MPTHTNTATVSDAETGTSRVGLCFCGDPAEHGAKRLCPEDPALNEETRGACLRERRRRQSRRQASVDVAAMDPRSVAPLRAQFARSDRAAAEITRHSSCIPNLCLDCSQGL